MSVDEQLAIPLDPVEAEQHRRDRFGMAAEDLRDREQGEAAFWGTYTHDVPIVDEGGAP